MHDFRGRLHHHPLTKGPHPEGQIGVLVIGRRKILIEAAELVLAELEQLLASPELYRDGDKVKQTTKAFEETKANLQQLYEHWEEAVELNGK